MLVGNIDSICFSHLLLMYTVIAILQTILGTFDDEQSKFCAQLKKEENSCTSLPWDSLRDQSVARKQMLGLSLVSLFFVLFTVLATFASMCSFCIGGC